MNAGQSGKLARGGNLANRRVAKPFAQLREIETSWHDMFVERFDMAVLFGWILQRDIEYNGIHAKMPERKILRRRWFLHQETSFAIPEDGVRPCPSDVDVLPEARCQRRLNIVVKIAGGPLLVRLA